MKTLQDSEDMLKFMADSMNLSVPEFEKLMKEERGLASVNAQKAKERKHKQ